MENQPKLILSTEDFQKISNLLQATDQDTALLLEEELHRATIMPDHQVPSNVVSMHSFVKFIDVENNKESQITLVYPHEARIDENKISVLAPLGAALIGLSIGQSIQWPMPHGKKRTIQVTQVQKK